MKKIAITDYTFPDLGIEEAVLRPEGIEIVEALFGAVHVDKLDNESAVVLREAEGKLSLAVIALP